MRQTFVGRVKEKKQKERNIKTKTHDGGRSVGRSVRYTKRFHFNGPASRARRLTFRSRAVGWRQSGKPVSMICQ